MLEVGGPMLAIRPMLATMRHVPLAMALVAPRSKVMVPVRPAVMGKMSRSVATRSFVVSDIMRTTTVVTGRTPFSVASANAVLGQGRTAGTVMPAALVMEVPLITVCEVRPLIRPRTKAVMCQLLPAMLKVMQPRTWAALIVFMPEGSASTMMISEASPA
jgi:hypothetical protein